jgi:hypothetical protein
MELFGPDSVPPNQLHKYTITKKYDSHGRHAVTPGIQLAIPCNGDEYRITNMGFVGGLPPADNRRLAKKRVQCLNKAANYSQNLP